MLKTIEDDCNARMHKSIEALEASFSKIRAGRANPSLLEHIKVDYYGAMVPISQVASINAEDARTLKVMPWEKAMIGAIEKAIITSDLGLNPNTQGEVMRIPLPQLTAERRKELVRIVKEEAENAKISVRNIRRDSNNQIKELLKDKDTSTDEAKNSEDNIQKITDKFIAIVDDKLIEKEKSLTVM